MYHNDIDGIDAAGRRRHSLSPETFYWAHAVFFMSMIRFIGGVPETERERLFDEQELRIECFYLMNDETRRHAGFLRSEGSAAPA